MFGLTDKEVLESRKKYGSNKISIKNENKFIKLLLESLGDPIIKIMLIALSFRFILMFKETNWYETLGMLISIMLSSLISSLSEYGSQSAFKTLMEEYQSIKVKVKRNNHIVEINEDEVVVGDLVLIEAGEKIVADGVIIDGYLGVDESSLNGESDEVFKKVNDKVYRGSIALSNRAMIKVTNVGINTIYGNIAKELSENVPDSPMKIRLRSLAKTISKIGVIGAILVSLSYLFNVIFVNNNFDIEVIKSLLLNPKYTIDLIIHAVTISLTILIVCVPEGLPMMIALVLSSNMKRMLKSNVLVRKLVGIETSGSLNVLLFDKTGTITKGKLSVVGFVDGDGNSYNNLNEIKDDLASELINAIIYNTDSIIENNQIIGGNNTDKALIKFVGKQSKKYEIISKETFNSINKYSSVTLDNKDKYYKGASEVLLNKCFYYLDSNGIRKVIKNKNSLNNIVDKYTKLGIRVIVIIKNSSLIGFILLKDEIRKEAFLSIRNIENAGIHTIMITGDALLTATCIAKELNMLNKDSLVLTHDDLVQLSDEELLLNYHRIKVIARALPSDKSRVASLLEKNGLVVGMTGDGVNDAPALKKASVGISLGSGVDVAKEASDIVILDDNIKSIENAILYGRTIFRSIRKFIIFQLTINLCALFLSIVGPFIGITTPITIMQMLWLNMIMDTLAGIAFSYCPPKDEYMKNKPIKKDEKILNKYMYISIIVGSLASCIILILYLKLPIIKLFVRNDLNHFLTGFFSLFIFLSIFNAFNARTVRINILADILKNKVFILIMLFIFIFQIIIIYYGGSLFRTFGLNIKELLFVLIISLAIIPIDMLKKIILKAR